MRRTLLALAAGTALLTAVPAAPASATHACAEGFEILCTRICVTANGREVVCVLH